MSCFYTFLFSLGPGDNANKAFVESVWAEDCLDFTCNPDRIGDNPGTTVHDVTVVITYLTMSGLMDDVPNRFPLPVMAGFNNRGFMVRFHRSSHYLAHRGHISSL